MGVAMQGAASCEQQGFSPKHLSTAISWAMTSRHTDAPGKTRTNGIILGALANVASFTLSRRKKRI
jgi:hypothetical protein